ncbi:uncharacterized protein [Asterias amurensis]|uniref:uncharacterized protein n=1 Tax=Asterias amurensis TaxID=7602 RepID=UPI003AB17ABB
MTTKYERMRVIGRGTFGLAWLTRSKSSQRLYVLKEVVLSGMTEKDRHQAVNEVAILAGLRHANVVRYREAFVDGGMLNIAMEYADKGDLGEIIKTNKQANEHFPESQIMDWFVQICFALRYIHAKKILHRDLKPQNIFMTSQGIIKVGDFGIARMLRDTNDHANTAIGTPYYMSPEICRRKPYNQKSDMWAAGCVLYEMTSLVHPFEATDFSTLVVRILRGRYKSIPRHYGPLLEDLIAVLLRVDPGRRPSADQLLAIPGINVHVLAYTNRCKTHWLPVTVAADSRSSSSQYVEEGGGRTQNGLSRKSSRVHQILEDSAVTSRRHSVASERGCDRTSLGAQCPQSDNKFRRNSCGNIATNATNDMKDRGEHTSKCTVDISTRARPVAPCLKTGHRASIITHERLQSTGSTGESVRHEPVKKRCSSLDIVDKVRSERSASLRVNASNLSKAPRQCVKSEWKEGMHAKMTKQASGGESNTSILDLFTLESKDRANNNRSLKRSTYVLETPSTTSKAQHQKSKCVLGTPSSTGKAQHQRQAFAKEIHGKTEVAGLRENQNGVQYGDSFREKTKECTLRDGLIQQDKLNSWMGTNTNCLWNTVVGRRQGSNSPDNNLADHASSRGLKDEQVMRSKDMNECLFRCRLQAGDSPQTIRGKMETLLVYLEDSIGAESTSLCLNLVKMASGHKVCPVPDEGVLRAIEGVLGKEHMTYVPVLIHLHNLEQSCDWLSA